MIRENRGTALRTAYGKMIALTLVFLLNRALKVASLHRSSKPVEKFHLREVAAISVYHDGINRRRLQSAEWCD